MSPTSPLGDLLRRFSLLSPLPNRSPSAFDEWPTESARIGVPKRYQEASLSDRPTQCLTYVDEYMKQSFTQGKALLLAGKTGAGKTHAAVAALRSYSGHSKRFVYFPMWISALGDFKTKAEALRQCLEVRFLVFDDFCTEFQRGNANLDASLESVIWHREANMLPTIFTTNHTAESLRACLLDRALDRLGGQWCIRKATVEGSLRRDK